MLPTGQGGRHQVRVPPECHSNDASHVQVQVSVNKDSSYSELCYVKDPVPSSLNISTSRLSHQFGPVTAALIPFKLRGSTPRTSMHVNRSTRRSEVWRAAAGRVPRTRLRRSADGGTIKAPPRPASPSSVLTVPAYHLRSGVGSAECLTEASPQRFPSTSTQHSSQLLAAISVNPSAAQTL